MGFLLRCLINNAMRGDGFCDYIFGRIQCADFTDAIGFYFAFHGDHQAHLTSMIRVSTRSARSVLRGLPHPGFDLVLVLILDATRKNFRLRQVSVLFIKVLEFFVFYAAFFEEAFFTSDLVRTTGSGSSFWDSVRSLSFSWISRTVS